jgi:hypothetical protein
MEPIPHGTGAAVACELYRESIYWALSAYRELREPVPEPSASAASAASLPSMGELLAETPDDVLSVGSSNAADRDQVRAILAERTFVDFAELDPGEQARTARTLGAFGQALLAPLEEEWLKLERRYVRRVAAGLGAVLGLVALVLVVVAVGRWRERRVDLAAGASWTASSKYPEGGCGPREQRCEGSPNFFFCTTATEPKPWLLIDLGKVQPFSGIAVENRLDCCGDRAVPLFVQVSRDNREWKTVARRREPFTTWRERFPRVRARWVKLYVDRPSYFHLSQVRVLP